MAGDPFYASCILAVIAAIGLAMLYRRRFAVVLVAALALAGIAVVSWVGVQSSARLAEVRARSGQRRSADTSLEARNIASDWATVLLISNVTLALALVILARETGGGTSASA